MFVYFVAGLARAVDWAPVFKLMGEGFNQRIFSSAVLAVGTAN
jgi:hypothetical protein